MNNIQTPSFNSAAAVAGDVVNSREVVVLRGGDRVVIRPISTEDIELERSFIEGLSPASRRFRFLESMRTPSDVLLKQLTAIDCSTDAAFVAVIGEGRTEREVGVGRLSASADGHDCEFAITVIDAWQHKGLGTLLMRRLMDVAHARGIRHMHSSDAADNELMRKFAGRLHMQHKTDPEDTTLVVYSVDLETKAAKSIELTQAREVSEWCRSLACTEHELHAAVATVGNVAEHVQAYLEQRRHPRP
jgi:GNAT superfamily N-acetyltransferase